MSFKHLFKSFFRNFLPKFLFPFTLLIFMYQLHCNLILYTNNSSKNSKYKYFLLLYIIFYLLYLISSINIYFTPPGYVTEETNERFIFIYKVSRKFALERGRIYNIKHNNSPNPPYHFEDGTYIYDSDWDKDEYEFKQTLNQKNLYNKCKEELSFLYIKNASNVLLLKLIVSIIVNFAINVFIIWIIIAFGLINALDNLIKNILFYLIYIYFWLHF